MVPKLAAGFAFGVGVEPTPELPALGADLFPVEVRLAFGLTSVAVQLDPAQLALDTVLTSRRWVGVAGFVERREPLAPALDLRWGLGLDGAVGTEARVVVGELRHPAGGALAPAGRLGLLVSGPGDRYHQGLGVRGALGVRSSAEGAVPYARALVEATFLWGAR
jgi:hypothetical protein